MPQPVSEETKQKWKEKILNQQESGLSIASWCRQNNIVVHTFYYWRDKFFLKTALNRSDFAEIPNEKKTEISNQKSGITIEYRGFHISVDHQFNSSVLKQCVQILKEITC